MMTISVQSSPVQSSPVQSSPVQSSPVQSSPVQSSPVRKLCLVIALTGIAFIGQGAWAGGYDITTNNQCKVWNSDQGKIENKTATWSGSCVDGYASGNGVIQWYINGKEGERYTGDVLQGKHNGKGVFIWSNGDKYDGEWINGNRYGKGIHTLKNGDTYRQWVGGKYRVSEVGDGLIQEIIDRNKKLNCTAKINNPDNITSDGGMGYEFSPIPYDLSFRYFGEYCDKVSVVLSSPTFIGFKGVEIYSQGKLHALYWMHPNYIKSAIPETAENKRMIELGKKYCGTDYECWVFADGEVWRGFFGYSVKRVRDNNRIVAEREKQAAEKERLYQAKVANLRKNIKVGDDTSAGLVIEIKGDLIKIQTNDSQCSQRDYKGNCTNYINTPVEKWVKRSELYPAS